MIDIASDGKAMIFLETGLNPRVGYFKNEEEGEDFILTGIEEISLDPELEA